MTTNIEREIVSIALDTKELSKGVKRGVEDIEKLKKSMDLENVSKKSLGEVKKLSSVDFGPMSSSIGAVSNRISLLGVAGAAVVFRLTNAIIDMGKKLANALVFDPIKTGLEEYETQLNAVQTILANTQKKGTTLEDVNNALDELNLYADLTIYNFTQMTENIGKFTAAGVDLDTSVQSIKGIANLAALSGSNANQASVAMYQLSQAIASGVVRLQDWNSVQNAGMGGQVFQDALIETARLYDENIDQMIEKSGGFRNSLQENWLTAQILTETLAKFTGDLSQAQLEAMGYTSDQAAEIVKMAETANDAATKIKTFTQLVDTMKEALQSGWALTWRTIFGDFEQAKELWGSVADVIGGLIEQSSEARNALLQMWAEGGGRSYVIQAFLNIMEAGVNVITAFREAIAEIFPPVTSVQLITLSREFIKFSRTLLEGSKNLDSFKTVIKALAAILDIAKIALLAVLEPIIEYVKTLAPAANSFGNFILRVSEGILAFRDFAKETGFFDKVVADVIAGTGELIDRFIELVQQLGEVEIINNVVTWLQSITQEDLDAWWAGFIDVLNQFIECVVKVVEKVSELAIAFYELDVVQQALEWLRSIERADCIRWWNSFLDTIEPVVEVMQWVAEQAENLYNEFTKLEVVQDVGGYFADIEFSDIVDAFKRMGQGIRDLVDSISQSPLFIAFLEYLKTFDGRRFNEFLAEARERFGSFGDILEDIKEKFEGFTSSMEGINTAEVDTTQIEEFFQSLAEGAANVDYEKLFDNIIRAVNTALGAGLILALTSILRGVGDIVDKLFGDKSALFQIAESFAGAMGAVESTLGTVQNNIRADTLQKIAVAIAILAGSLILLTLVDTNKLLDAAGAIAIMTATLFGGAGALGQINVGDAAKAAVALTGISTALLIASAALVNISKIPEEGIKTGLAAMAAGLVGLVAAVNAISSNTASMVKTIGVLFGLASSLYLLVGVIRRFGELEPDVLQQGLLGVAQTLAIVAGAIVVLSKSAGGSIGAAISVLEIAAALLTLASAVERFGEMDIGTLQQGLTTVGALLAGFATFSRLLKPSGLLQAGLALLVMSGALIIMANALQSFGGLSIEELQVGLLGLAASLGALVIAANLMTGALPGAAATIVMASAILILAGALTLMSAIPFEGLLVALGGLAAVFVVLGLAGLLLAPLVPVLLGLGAAMLLFGLAAGVLGLGILAASSGLVALAAAGAGVGAAIGVIGAAIMQIIPQIGAAIAEGMTNFLQTIADNMPKILEAWNTILLGLLEATIGMIPEMVAAILDMVTQLLEAIASRLPDLVQAGFDILLAFIQGIEDNIAEVVEAGLGVLTEFLNGIAEGLPDLVDSAFNVILTFLNSIADAIEEYMPKILAAGARIGTALLEGLKNAITDGAQAVVDLLTEIANNALASFKAFWGIESPSKLMYEMGVYIFEGLLGGFANMARDVEDNLYGFFNNLKGGLVSILNSIMDEVEGDAEFEPVITPVVDLDAARANLGSLNSIFGGARSLGSIAASDSGYYQTGEPAVAGASTRNVSFVQNNYSPKALDRVTIYRQSRTYAAKLGLLEL